MRRVRIRLKLVKKDFGKWDKEELSLIVKGYTARQIADHILDNQKIVDELRKLDLSHLLRYTGTRKGDKWEKHNDTIKEIVRLLK